MAACGYNPEKRVKEWGRTSHDFALWNDFLPEADAVVADLEAAGRGASAVLLNQFVGGAVDVEVRGHQITYANP